MTGYFRSPTIQGDTIVFVCEDDLWTVPREGGVARRLTTSVGAVNLPCLSPDGQWLAYTGREEGAWEVEVMPAQGGEPLRLTFQGALAETIGWTPDGQFILYSSESGMPFGKARRLWRISPEGGDPELLPYGVANRISWGPKNQTVLARHAGEPARWKRYRGGTAGQLWIDRSGRGQFERLLPAEGNITAPMWIGNRIYFVSDHEGVGNLYSCTASGKQLKRHTHRQDFYVRGAKTDGKYIVYHAGGDLYVFDVAADSARKLAVELNSPRGQLRRKFVDAARYVQEYALSPNGQATAITTRGKLFSLYNWEGPVLQHGEPEGVRYRMTEWLNDGKRLVTVSDSGGEEALEVHDRNECRVLFRLDSLDIGRPTGLFVSPAKDKDLVLLRNHRFELLLVDLQSHTLRMLDRSDYGDIAGMSWSPDGRWVAYSFADSQRTRIIRVCDTHSGNLHDVTRPEFDDHQPAWDPEGKYLYFLSYRVFNPVYDALHFELAFPKAMRPMLVLLQKTLTNPFIPAPQPPEAAKKPAEGEENKETTETQPVLIDWEGIEHRILAFPVGEGRFRHLHALKGKVLYSSFPAEGALPALGDKDSEPKGEIKVFDLKALKEETLVTGVTGFTVSQDLSTLMYSGGKKLRAIKAGEKPPEVKDKPRDGGRSAGWIDLHRIKVAVRPQAEWRQMYREAWRLQRDHFWTSDMSGVDWELVYQHYLPLVDRVATRGEFSDLMWEMQGELGTSHAYEIGGDYRLAPNLAHGFLGAEFVYDADAKTYRISRLLSGDSWDEHSHAPLRSVPFDLHEGDYLLAINGRSLGPELSPGEALVNQAGQEVEVVVKSARDQEIRRASVKTINSEAGTRYRDWVNANRRHVHERSEGQIGYLHIPDMVSAGFAEFHRGWLAELRFPALLVDVRYNGGGHVSQLLLEKLARRRLGYDIMRWGQPMPYPYDSLLGPMAALTNEQAGSDGDMFSHCFKLLKLGPLIGMRTWGGVVGISKNNFLVDGSLTTQPEYAFWFEDVGWRLENYGADPDIEVNIAPQDYAEGRDPQLDKGIDVILQLLREHPVQVPDFGDRPKLGRPTLPE